MSDGPVRPRSSSARAATSETGSYLGSPFAEASTAVCVLDSTGRIEAINESMAILFGRDRADAVGLHWREVAHHDADAEEAVLLEKTLSRASARHQIEERLTRADGTGFWCRITATALNAGARPLVLVEAVDTTNEHELEARTANAEERMRVTTTAFQEELRRLAIAATTDQGTGLKNRRGFFALAQHELNLAQRLGHPLTLIFFDLDRLKYINDTFGHLEGDRAIADTARLLSTTFRESDLVARLGGDEFCVLALGPPEAFAQTMRRFESALDEHNRGGGRRYRLALSYGVAFFEPLGLPVSLDELMSQADSSMYATKSKRRSA